MTTRVTAHLSRGDAGTPWGFRIAGGRDFGAPVTVQRVVPGGVAERAGIVAGDKLVDISGSQVSEMCHRDAQMAIRNSGNSLKMEIDRDNSVPSKPVAAAIPSSAVTRELRNLEIRGTNYNPEEADSGQSAVNTTAQPWRPRKSIDASSGISPHLSRILPTGGFQPVSASLPHHNPKSSTVPREMKVSGPKPFDVQSAAIVETPAWKPSEEKSSNYSDLQDSGLRKTQEHSSLPRYQTLMEPQDASRGGDQSRKSSTPAFSHRYQPSSEASRLSQRGSDPAVTSLQQHQANSASLPPTWQRKGSDCTPTPFAAPYKPPNSVTLPTVAPKPAGDRMMSLDRGWTPPSSHMAPKAPSPPVQPVQPVPQKWTPPAPRPEPKETRNEAANATQEKPSKNRAPANCHHCKEQIRGPYLMALDRYYCPDHFRCVKCEVPLGKQPFIAHEGAVYCVEDFRNYVAPRCAKCKEPVAEQQLLALDKVYHPQCFICTMCKEPMNEGSFRIGTDNMPYCDADWKAHFQVICGRCEFPIEADEQFIDALSKSYHVECFVCTTCHTKLEGKAFYLRNDQPYCRDHIQSH